MFNFRLLFLCALAALPALCVETRFWQQGEFADFEKGNLTKISVRSDGRLSLAPVTRELLDSSTPYLWAVAQDSKGNVYAGGGGPSASTAKLFEVDPQGHSKVIAELDGLEIHAIAVDSKDRVYAATAPDGKVYRVANGKTEVFFDPKAKYIWALAFSRSGDLFIATGDKGDLYRVTPDGKGSVFFRTEETHARSLAVDREGNLIVGTEPGGVVLRVSPDGTGFVLYQTPKREVTAVAVAADGSIYAAAVGVRTAAPPVTLPAPAVAAPAPAPAAAGGVQVTVAPAKPAAAPPPTFVPSSVTGGSELYRIYPDGSPRRVWSHPQDIAYALAFDREGHPMIGTGNRGNLYRIDSDLRYTLLVNLAPTQVTGFATGRGGEILAVTGNIGKLYRIGPDVEKQGSYESEAFDGGAFTYWGRLTYTGDANGGKIGIEARSGNVSHPQKNWSAWSAVPLAGDGGRIASPAARFVQYKLTLDSAADGKSPEIRGVEVAYLAKNVAPVVREVEMTPSNYKFTASILLSPTGPASLTLPPMGQKRSTGSIDLSAGGSQTLTYAKGQLGVRWLAQDENNDSLLFRVEIRGANEKDWKLLRDKVRDRFLSWDSTAFPDGKYVIRVCASDSPSNPPDQALDAELVGDPFYIDNTPPRVIGLAASAAAGGKLAVEWKAQDAASIVDKAEYSVNGGDWTVVQPVTKLSDAMDLDYKLTLDRPAGEVTIAVRVTDEYENQTVEKVVVR